MTEPLDVYADGTQIATGAFDLTLYFSKREPVVPRPGRELAQMQVGCVRMSLEAAKVLAIMLKRQIKYHEESQDCPVKLHPDAVKALGISVEEDW